MSHPRHIPPVARRGDETRLAESAFAWQTLRALTQDLLTAPDQATKRRVRIAIEQLLMSRCGQCGALLSDPDDRADPLADRCLACRLTSATPIPVPDDTDDVPF